MDRKQVELLITRKPIIFQVHSGSILYIQVARGGGTIWLNNSLNTRLKYIKITFKINFYKQNLVLAPIEFFQRGARGGAPNYSRFLHEFTKTQIISKGGPVGGHKNHRFASFNQPRAAHAKYAPANYMEGRIRDLFRGRDNQSIPE